MLGRYFRFSVFAPLLTAVARSRHPNINSFATHVRRPGDRYDRALHNLSRDNAPFLWPALARTNQLPDNVEMPRIPVVLQSIPSRFRDRINGRWNRLECGAPEDVCDLESLDTYIYIFFFVSLCLVVSFTVCTNEKMLVFCWILFFFLSVEYLLLVWAIFLCILYALCMRVERFWYFI